MNHGSLFSGIGGFDLAAEWMGWNNIFHCEWNEFGKWVLKYYWPNAISYDDITKTDFTIHRGTIDILTGGFPCQPYSHAGKRLGKEDDRHLWPEMRRAIREIAPRYVVGENVSGLLSWNGGMVFDEVQADLENEGYEVLPVVLPACGVNAPHRRDRVWFIANAIDRGNLRQSRKYEGKGQEEWLQERHQVQQSKKPIGLRPKLECITSNPCHIKLQGSEFYGSIKESREIEGESRQSGRSVRSKWEQFPTQSPVCDGNDGIPPPLDGITFSKWRNESIKAGGNAIVPQVAYEIFKSIEKTDKTHPN